VDTKNVNNVYSTLIRILLEQSYLIISDNIEYLTTIVLGLSYLIQPFKWPFILIPNLPLDLLNMVESPVPFLIGVLGDKNSKHKFINNENISANIISYVDNTFEFIVRDTGPYEEPNLSNLKQIIYNNISMTNYYLNTKKIEEYDKYCEVIYKNIYETFKCEISEVIEKEIRKSSNVRISIY
jgi:hypothetical protein